MKWTCIKCRAEYTAATAEAMNYTCAKVWCQEPLVDEDGEQHSNYPELPELY